MFKDVSPAPVNPSHSTLHCVKDLIRIFNRLFSQSENTRLIRGADEPVYIPAGADCAYHQLVFAHGYFASALHEIAHWCVAGPERRRLVDYGYWYIPDGRNQQQQREFEVVEVKPQALEWVLSRGCNKRFRVSVDNLGGEPTDSGQFKRAVQQQAINYCQRGLPARAKLLHAALCRFYGTPSQLQASCFSLSELG